MMLQYAEAWARKRGCSSIGLQSNTVRDRAHHFYDRAGYKNVKSQFALEKKL